MKKNTNQLKLNLMTGIIITTLGCTGTIVFEQCATSAINEDNIKNDEAKPAALKLRGGIEHHDASVNCPIQNPSPEFQSFKAAAKLPEAVTPELQNACKEPYFKAKNSLQNITATTGVVIEAVSQGISTSGKYIAGAFVCVVAASAAGIFSVKNIFNMFKKPSEENQHIVNENIGNVNYNSNA